MSAPNAYGERGAGSTDTRKDTAPTPQSSVEARGDVARAASPDHFRALARRRDVGFAVAAGLNAAADEIEMHRQFLELLDSAGVKMNGLPPTEALARIRKIAAPSRRGAEVRDE